eukprot:5835870-Amphidinium_carterae.1
MGDSDLKREEKVNATPKTGQQTPTPSRAGINGKAMTGNLNNGFVGQQGLRAVNPMSRKGATNDHGPSATVSDLGKTQWRCIQCSYFNVELHPVHPH